MAQYDAFLRGPGRRTGPGGGRRARGGEERGYGGRGTPGYGGEFGGRAARPGGAGYGEELRPGLGRLRMPRKPAHGYPVRGYHTYDLDYGSIGGPTTDYSGRAGYPTPEPPGSYLPRGPYEPVLGETEERTERSLYEASGREYRPRRFGGGRPR